MKNKIQLPIYNADIVCFFNEEEYNKYCSENNQHETNKVAAGVTCHFFNDEGFLIIVIGIFNNNTAILVHELVHVCSKIFLTHGILYDTENDEPYAYLMGYLFESVMELMYEYFNEEDE